MQKGKKIKAGEKASLIAGLMKRAGVAPFGDAQYLRGAMLTWREEYKSISSSEFMVKGAVVIPFTLEDTTRSAAFATLSTVIEKTLVAGDWLETFKLSGTGDVLRAPVPREIPGAGNPMDEWQRGHDALNRVRCIVIPGRVIDEVQMNFAPYMFVGLSIMDSDKLEFVRVSLPITTEQVTLSWFRQFYRTYAQVVF